MAVILHNVSTNISRGTYLVSYPQKVQRTQLWGFKESELWLWVDTYLAIRDPRTTHMNQEPFLIRLLPEALRTAEGLESFGLGLCVFV